VQIKEDVKEQKEQEIWNGLCAAMIELVRQQPGKSRSYYERLPVAQGGVRSSQERKERIITSLLNDGSLERVELEKPQGRANHYLRVNEEVVESIERGKYGL